MISVPDDESDDVFLGCVLGGNSRYRRRIRVDQHMVGRLISFHSFQHGVIDTTDPLLESWVVTFFICKVGRSHRLRHLKDWCLDYEVCGTFSTLLIINLISRHG